MRRFGLSLIEVLVVIAILGVLIGLLIPVISSVRAAAANTSCQNNLKQLGLAAHSFHDLSRSFPIGHAQSDMSAQGALLPFLEQASTYALFDQSKPLISDSANATARTQIIHAFICPSDTSTGAIQDLSDTSKSEGLLNYYVNAGSLGIWWERRAGLKPSGVSGMFSSDFAVPISDVKDGASNTVLFAEIKRGSGSYTTLGPNDIVVIDPGVWEVGDPTKNPNNVTPGDFCSKASDPSWWWTDGSPGLQYYYGFPATTAYTHTVPPNYSGTNCFSGYLEQFHLASRSYHKGGVNVVFVDGSVHFIQNSVDMSVWRALGTRSGYEVDLKGIE